MRCLFHFLCLIITAFSVTAQLPQRSIHDLKTGRRPDDTSFVYGLPYAMDHKFLLIQGANSSFSHKNELAYDFKMKKNSQVCAARRGVVIDSRGDSDKGGLNEAFMNDGNYLIILHEDGSKAYYWHLIYNGLKVNTGDTVEQGQLIALSGNTGYSAFPHLHFQVTDAAGRQVLVRFLTKKGNRYLRPGRWYKRIEPR